MARLSLHRGAPLSTRPRDPGLGDEPGETTTFALRSRGTVVRGPTILATRHSPGPLKVLPFELPQARDQLRPLCQT
jgi:hypothetical protein